MNAVCTKPMSKFRSDNYFTTTCTTEQGKGNKVFYVLFAFLCELKSAHQRPRGDLGGTVQRNAIVWFFFSISPEIFERLCKGILDVIHTCKLESLPISISKFDTKVPSSQRHQPKSGLAIT